MTRGFNKGLIGKTAFDCVFYVIVTYSTDIYTRQGFVVFISLVLIMLCFTHFCENVHIFFMTSTVLLAIKMLFYCKGLFQHCVWCVIETTVGHIVSGYLFSFVLHCTNKLSTNICLFNSVYCQINLFCSSIQVMEKYTTAVLK